MDKVSNKARYPADTTVTADVSSIGIDAVLTQWLPIAFALRALTPTEGRYAQIEKEALTITYTCERFQEYLIRKSFHIHQDCIVLVLVVNSVLAW